MFFALARGRQFSGEQERQSVEYLGLGTIGLTDAPWKLNDLQILLDNLILWNPKERKLAVMRL